MIKPPELFLTQSLRESPWGIPTARILAAALNAVDPAAVINRVITREKDILQIANKTYNLGDYKQIHLLAIGKAAYPMAISTADLLSERLSAGIILTKPGEHHLPERYQNVIKILYGGHPVPNQGSLDAAAEITSQFSDLTPEELVIVLISGGGSALFTSPVPEISFSDLQQTNQVLLDSGANIQEINTIRKHLSLVKGGQLARNLSPAKVVTCILSDVIGNPMGMIASGPTLPDRSTYQDALSVIQTYQLEKALPPAVIKHLKNGRSGKFPETPKPADPIFRNQASLILASNQDAVQGAAEQAKQEGFHVQILPDPLIGEARLAGIQLAKMLKHIANDRNSLPRPICLIAGGETTVTISSENKPGQGGRNLELALSAVRELEGAENAVLITLATDGEDGVTDAAGAVVTEETIQRANHLELNPDDFLDNHDAYPFFDALGDLLLTGVTQTNVNDLCILFIH